MSGVKIWYTLQSLDPHSLECQIFLINQRNFPHHDFLKEYEKKKQKTIKSYFLPSGSGSVCVLRYVLLYDLIPYFV